jgi:Protein of unknown function (DUF3592)
MPMTEEVFTQRVKLFIFSIVWIGCLTGLIYTVENTKAFLAAAVTASGRVVALNAGGSHPEIEFVTRKGALISYPQGGWISGYKVGDKVKVLYLENAPSTSATVDRIGAVWGWSIAFIPFLLMFPATVLWNILYKSMSKKDESKWKISG